MQKRSWKQSRSKYRWNIALGKRVSLIKWQGNMKWQVNGGEDQVPLENLVRYSSFLKSQIFLHRPWASEGRFLNIWDVPTPWPHGLFPGMMASPPLTHPFSFCCTQRIMNPTVSFFNLRVEESLLLYIILCDSILQIQNKTLYTS